jgi:hypothetical protein
MKLPWKKKDRSHVGRPRKVLTCNPNTWFEVVRYSKKKKLLMRDAVDRLIKIGLAEEYRKPLGTLDL